MPRSLIELGLRGPTLGVLQRQGILSVVQLMAMTPDELMGMRRVGLSRMLEIRQALQAHGLDLKVEASAPAIRSWESARRVRLTCCDSGECTLDLKTAGSTGPELTRVVEQFVAGHKSCARLGGRSPVYTVTETTRSPLAAPGRSEDDSEEEAEGARSA